MNVWSESMSWVIFCEILLSVDWGSVLFLSWAKSNKNMSIDVKNLALINNKIICEQLQFHHINKVQEMSVLDQETSMIPAAICHFQLTCDFFGSVLIMTGYLVGSNADRASPDIPVIYMVK